MKIPVSLSPVNLCFTVYFECGHPKGWEVLALCGFDLHFYDNWYSCIFIAYLFIFVSCLRKHLFGPVSDLRGNRPVVRPDVAHTASFLPKDGDLNLAPHDCVKCPYPLRYLLSPACPLS